ncbi:MAG: glycosyltransferase family 1 protein [Bryobacterales bacterium]|nr:glycosyltransferase family 4 protein [Bryobacteraceae bacterium]MDW8353992.1 glycosyltransferase family 1 protein [Bryobacterales bacterium]
MRIVIDATPLLLRSAGVKNHLYYWIRHLQALRDGYDIRAFPAIRLPGQVCHERSVLGSVATWARLAYVGLANYTPLPVLDWTRARADVFHASHQCWNPPRRGKLTTTIHDLTSWLMPELHSRANVRGMRRFARAVLERADAMIAISEHTRADAVAILGLPADRIRVIYPGVPAAFFRVTVPQAHEVAEFYRLPVEFVLFVGTVEPRKNLDRLLDAYAALPASLRKTTPLVVVGPVGWRATATLRRLSSEEGVRYLGYVPEDHLPALTAAASVFVYPSLYEGFGLPLAQAMAAGVACVTSRVSSLPEVAGDAALLVDPENVVELREAMERLLTDYTLRFELGARARARASRYCWKACALTSLEFFRSVVRS